MKKAYRELIICKNNQPSQTNSNQTNTITKDNLDGKTTQQMKPMTKASVTKPYSFKRHNSSSLTVIPLELFPYFHPQLFADGSTICMYLHTCLYTVIFYLVLAVFLLQHHLDFFQIALHSF